jgi:hypothetical protein
MTVVIANGRIANLGGAASVSVPTGARVVDASGKFLIPGLWDMHVHWYDEASLPLFTVNGVVGVRIMCGFPRHLEWRRSLNPLAPRLVIAGPIVDGPQPVWPDSLKASSETEGRAAAKKIKESGYDCVKVYDLLPCSAYLGVAAEARSLGLPLVGHVPYSISAATASDSGQNTIEHLSGVALGCSSREAELRKAITCVRDQDGPITAAVLRVEVQALDSYDERKAAGLFGRFATNQTWQVPTLSVGQSHASLRRDSTARTLRLRYLPSSMQTRWESRRSGTLKKLSGEDFLNYEHALRGHLKLVKAMHEAGVGLLAGTDTGALDCFPGFNLHDELELLVRAGLTPMEALQAATRNPAMCFERLDELGTVEKSKLAELVLLDANPLEDIRNTTRIWGVIRGGQLFSKEFLHATLDEIAKTCRQPKPDTFPGNYPKYP